VLNIAFRVADEEGLLLLDLKDLRAISGFRCRTRGGTHNPVWECSKATVGTIQPSTAGVGEPGRHGFFWRTGLALKDFMRTDAMDAASSICCADKLMETTALRDVPPLALSELFEALPEVGDLDKRSSCSSR